jgi:hypothetical protein
MAKDASSGMGRSLAPTAGNSVADPASKVPRGSTNLTQELAQLLAASIAQNQANRVIPSGMPTNAELTSLAQLVSAASGQRTLAPVFKDGLSALSYTKPQARHTDPVEPELPPDDEPMPIPSTWREPAVSDDQRWYRQQMGAAFLGLVAGLMIVVPSVLWLSGRIGPLKLGAPAEHELAAVSGDKSGDFKTVKVQVRPVTAPVEKRVESAAQYVTRPPPDRQSTETVSLTASDARMAEARRVEEILAQAARRVSSGDVIGARDMLAAAEDGAQGPVTFALAETYDPNMLAAWGSRGVTSDVVRARALYRKAQELGVTKANMRLEALK